MPSWMILINGHCKIQYIMILVSVQKNSSKLLVNFNSYNYITGLPTLLTAWYLFRFTHQNLKLQYECDTAQMVE